VFPTLGIAYWSEQKLNEIQAHIFNLSLAYRPTKDGDGLDTPLEGNGSSSKVLVCPQCLSWIIVRNDDLSISLITWGTHTLSRPVPPQETIALVVASD
jgi:hypothetical protein